MPEQCKVDYLVYTLSYEVETALIGKSSQFAFFWHSILTLICVKALIEQSILMPKYLFLGYLIFRVEERLMIRIRKREVLHPHLTRFTNSKIDNNILNSNGV